jgi:hypothetical protein
MHFTDEFNDHALFYAARDFGILVKDPPIEMQFFLAWWWSLHRTVHGNELPEMTQRWFPDLDQLDRKAQKLRGREALIEARHSLREVTLDDIVPR